MDLLKKSDLQYPDYTWTTSGDDDPRRTGSPDNVLLNRKEGYEVLPFLNRLAKDHKWSKTDALKAEWLIREHVPSSLRHRDNITKWLKDNWSEHDKVWNHKVARGDIA